MVVRRSNVKLSWTLLGWVYILVRGQPWAGRADCWPHSARTALGVEVQNPSEYRLWLGVVTCNIQGVKQVKHAVLHDSVDAVSVRESSSVCSSAPLTGLRGKDFTLSGGGGGLISTRFSVASRFTGDPCCESGTKRGRL